MHSSQVIGVDPWSLPIKYKDNHSLLKWPHTSKLKTPKYKSNQITFGRPKNISYKTILIKPDSSVLIKLSAMFISSLYSHITPGSIFSVKQSLNGSPFYGETPLNKMQKYKELA